MFEYRFERVDVHRDKLTYQHTVREHAAQGWRLVQLLVEQPAVMSQELVVILEREVPDHVDDAG